MSETGDAPDLANPDEPLPVSVPTGFPGSGHDVTCYGADILRLKGILNVADMDRPLVVHAVQHLFHPPVPLESWPDGDRSSRLVFITRDLDPETIQRSLETFNAAG